jgi:trehalose synthase
MWLAHASSMFEVDVSSRGIDAFAELLPAERIQSVRGLAERVRSLLGSRAIWNINSTATGGGVAEMVRSLVRYSRGLGVQVRWLVLDGTPEFFRITKRIHNALHDWQGDGSPLGPDERLVYERVMHDNTDTLDTLVRPGDIVICHDPQTAGLVPQLAARGVTVIWRCHIGHDKRSEEVDRGWHFLREYLEHVPLAAFSREDYAPDWLPRKRWVVLPPNIDPFSPKNQQLSEESIRAILGKTGLIDDAGSRAPLFVRDDGSVGRVDRKAEVIRLGRAPSYDTPLVVQVSRWDRMKDPVGVLRGFVEVLRSDAARGAHLVLGGPSVAGVIDDPEQPRGLQAVEHAWRGLPDSLREAVHIVQLPMIDNEENAAMVNALQRHATVIVQKSLHEGFGLTVTEAMWKRRPVVASSVGGIRDQIRDGVNGLLVHDPASVGEFSQVLMRALADPALRERLGETGYEDVREHYLSIVALENWAELVRMAFGISETAAQPSSAA